jgi:hypothetical protein
MHTENGSNTNTYVKRYPSGQLWKPDCQATVLYPDRNVQVEIVLGRHFDLQHGAAGALM